VKTYNSTATLLVTSLYSACMPGERRWNIVRLQTILRSYHTRCNPLWHD